MLKLSRNISNIGNIKTDIIGHILSAISKSDTILIIYIGIIDI